MKLRSGQITSKQPSGSYRVTTLRSGKKIRSPVSKKDQKRPPPPPPPQPSSEKANEIINNFNTTAAAAAAENLRIQKSNQRRIQLHPFTESNIQLLDKYHSEEAIGVRPKKSKLNSFLINYVKSNKSVRLCYQFIPTFEKKIFVLSFHLRIINSKKNVENLQNLFLLAWNQIINLTSALHKKPKRISRQKSALWLNVGFFCGLTYNVILSNEEDPNFIQPFYGHANEPENFEKNGGGFSILPEMYLSSSLDASNYIDYIKPLPHLQMSQYRYAYNFPDSQTRVCQILDYVFNYQQWTDALPNNITLRALYELPI